MGSACSSTQTLLKKINNCANYAKIQFRRASFLLGISSQVICNAIIGFLIMNKIVIENNPIWDKFKNRLFNIENPGAFSFTGLKIGTEFNCYACFVSVKDGVSNGVAILNVTDYDNKSKCLEINIAVDQSDRTNKSKGVNLLKKVESICKNSPYHIIIAVVKATNKKREDVAEWFYKNGYEVEGLLTQNDKSQRIKYYKNIFQKNNLTLSKNLQNS